MALAVAHAQLGEKKGAAKALQELLAMVPDFPKTARQGLSVWLDPELAESYVDGLRKAGLELTGASEAGSGKPAAKQFGDTRLKTRTTESQTRAIRHSVRMGAHREENSGGTEGGFAFVAGALGAEVVIAEDAGGVAIVEIDLDGVVADLRCGIGAGFGLVHGQERGGRKVQ